MGYVNQKDCRLEYYFRIRMDSYNDGLLYPLTMFDLFLLLFILELKNIMH